MRQTGPQMYDIYKQPTTIQYLQTTYNNTIFTNNLQQYNIYKQPTTIQYLQTTCNNTIFFDVFLTVHPSIFISVINQLDAQKFCFTISLYNASTCFEHMCSSSGDQNCITQPLVSSQL